MQQEDIEIQLWEYIDGTCSAGDSERIALLINSDAQWQEKHAELVSFHIGLQADIEISKVNPGFTEAVMTKIAAPKKAGRRFALNMAIKAVVCFFIIIITVSVLYAVQATDWHFEQANLLKGFSLTMPPAKLNLPEHLTTVLGFMTVITILIMADAFFRKNRISNM